MWPVLKLHPAPRCLPPSPGCRAQLSGLTPGLYMRANGLPCHPSPLACLGRSTRADSILSPRQDAPRTQGGKVQLSRLEAAGATFSPRVL